MAKSIKLKNNNYIDSTGVVHNRGLLSTLLNNITTNISNLLTNVSNLLTSVSNLETKTTQFKNKEYSGMTTSSTSFKPAKSIYLAVLWINAGALVLPALYVVTMNASGGGAVCCGASGNANLSVSGTTVTVNAPYGNAVFYSLMRISD